MEEGRARFKENWIFSLFEKKPEETDNFSLRMESFAGGSPRMSNADEDVRYPKTRERVSKSIGIGGDDDEFVLI